MYTCWWQRQSLPQLLSPYVAIRPSHSTAQRIANASLLQRGFRRFPSASWQLSRELSRCHRGAPRNPRIFPPSAHGCPRSLAGLSTCRSSRNKVILSLVFHSRPYISIESSCHSFFLKMPGLNFFPGFSSCMSSAGGGMRPVLLTALNLHWSLHFQDLYDPRTVSVQVLRVS